MARGHRNFRSNLIRTGRKTFWFGGVFVRSDITAINTAVLTTSLTAAALALRPFTIVRTRGIVTLRSDQIAATEQQQAAYGLTVVSDQAVAVGVTAVPSPVADSQSDWFVYQPMIGAFSFATAIGFEQVGLERYEIDSKAMRKVEEGQDVISVVESGAATGGITVSEFNRILIKLH